MTHHFNIVEGHLYVTVTLENTSKILDVLLFALFVILYLLRSETFCMFLHNHLSCDNQRIIAEHLVEKIDVFLIISCTELLYIVKD